MALSITRSPWYGALAAFTIAISIVGLGLAASLLSHYGEQMPGDALRRVVIQTTFAFTWTVLFGLILLLGGLIAPRRLGGVLPHFVIYFLTFLQLLVASGTLVVELSKVTCSASRCASLGPDSCISDQCSMFRALEAMAWIATWFVFGLIVLMAWHWLIHGSDDKEEDSKALIREKTSNSRSAPLSPRASRVAANGV